MAPHSIALLILLSNGDATIIHMDDTLMVDTLDREAYLYIHRFAYRTAHGKGTETRSQTRGAGERRRTQSAPRGHSRRLVHRQSLQVRYEMVRRHRVDGVAISEVSTNFGVSRPTFYKALR